LLDLKSEKTYFVVNYVLKYRRFEQKEIHKKTRVSKGWVSFVVNWLEEQKYVKKADKGYELVNAVPVFSLFKLFRRMEKNLLGSFSLKPEPEELIRELIKRKVVFCTTTALQEYSSYYQDPSINFYSGDKDLLEEIRTEEKGLTQINFFKPDLWLKIDIQKKGKMLLTSPVRTIIDLFCDNKAYTAKELIEKTYGERFG